MQSISPNKKLFQFINIVIIGFSIYFFGWMFVYKLGLNTLSVQSEDTLPALIMPVSIILDHTIYADKYYPEILKKYPQPDDKDFKKGSVPFYFKKIVVNDNLDLALNMNTKDDPSKKVAQLARQTVHYVSAFPIMTGILAVPVYYVPLSLGLVPNWENLIVWSHVASALIVAVSGGFFYLLVRYGFDVSESESELLSYIYMFGTINFALISQSLWQHGTLQLFVILALIFLQKAIKEGNKLFNLFFMGFFLGFAILSRPTSILIIPFLYILVIEKLSDISYNHFSKFKISTVFALIKGLIAPTISLLVGLVPAALFFAFYNQTYFGDVSNQGYASQLFSGWLSKFPEGFLGLWLSPSKGILVFSPIFIFSVLSLYFITKVGGFKKNLNFLVFFGIVIVHTIVMGLWKHWYGGWSFGYRMASDVIPFLVLLLIPVLRVPKFPQIKPFFILLTLASVVIQIYGMVFFDGIWHAAYDRGFSNTKWLWSVTDSQFAFDARRVLVKLKILEKACPQCVPVAGSAFPDLDFAK